MVVDKPKKMSDYEGLSRSYNYVHPANKDYDNAKDTMTLDDAVTNTLEHLQDFNTNIKDLTKLKSVGSFIPSKK